jgi:3-oxosteroid 1-dehydrogenase
MTAALAAADLGLSVVVVEKAGSFGGSTARSGGGIWAPDNAVLRAAGVTDTPDQARAYLAHVAGADVPAGLREAFLEHGPAMLDLVLARTALRLAWVPGYADYYPERPAGWLAGAAWSRCRWTAAGWAPSWPAWPGPTCRPRTGWPSPRPTTGG